jgi:WD40 repeat protein
VVPTPGRINGVAYLPGDRIAASSSDGMIRIWSTSRPTAPDRVLQTPGRVGFGALAASPDGRWLAAWTFDHTIRVWRLDSGSDEPVRTFTHLTATVIDLAFDRRGRYVAVAGSDAVVHVLDPEAGEEIGAMTRHSDSVNAVEFLADGRLLTAGDDGTAAVYPCSVCRPVDEIVTEARARDLRYQRPG